MAVDDDAAADACSDECGDDVFVAAACAEAEFAVASDAHVVSEEDGEAGGAGEIGAECEIADVEIGAEGDESTIWVEGTWRADPDGVEALDFDSGGAGGVFEGVEECAEDGGVAVFGGRWDFCAA